MAKDVMLSTRISGEAKESLADIAQATDRSVAWHVARAIEHYVDLHRWQIAAIEHGLEQSRTGQVVPAEDVRKWIASWGTKQELPMPHPKKKRR